MTAVPVVLVVEDEALIRLCVVDALREFGLDVREAANAVEAMQLLEQIEEPSLMFTDIDMPGRMNGIGLAREVSEKWPKITIVITSGMTQPSADDLPTGVTFIPKPYMVDDLAENLCALLRR